MTIKKPFEILQEPWRIVCSRKLPWLNRMLPDRLYLSCLYRGNCKQPIDWAHPKLFNEKLQWLKLHDRNARYTEMVDKAEAKRFIAERVGEQYVVPTIAVWDSPDQIDLDALPEQFVLKCTHDSAGLVICRDKSTFDFSAAKAKLSACLKRNFYYSGREWPYKNVRPRIIAEVYLEDDRYGELRDYKVFTFSGKPKVIHVVTNRGKTDEPTYGDFFDMDGKHLDLTMWHDNAPVPPDLPAHFAEMQKLAETLAADTIHLRVDFYEVNGQVYVGELTFYQDSGFGEILPPAWNEILGSWITLPENCKNR